jgi:predicted porin
MNNKIKLAVAGAVLSATSIANAGIVIPAGDWTVDINGNVNAFANWTDVDKTETVTGAIATGEDALGEDRTQGINTGLLPSWLGFTGTTRQNDVDVSFTISFQPNASDNGAAGDANTPLNRQAFLTFGDKSWGSVKVGKDLGIFAGDAILNDMTLLGVGGGAANSGGATTLGGIGTGYIYAAWKGQIAYTTPNMNGFQATIGITNPNQFSNSGAGNAAYQDRFGVEGKASYSWTGDVAGKVWASFATYEVEETAAIDYSADVFDIGATITSGNLGLTGYYYNGDGVGTTLLGAQGHDGAGNKRDSDGGYVQATYVIPTGTKLGLAYGISNLDEASGETGGNLVEDNERWTVGAYHPLTKHLNLVAEYNQIESEAHNGNERESDTFSLGAILFF